MPEPTVKWNDKQVMAQMKKGLERNLERACVMLVRDIKKRFPRTAKTKKERAGKHASRGQIPHIQTGALRRSIDHQIIRGKLGGPVGRVGVLIAKARGADAEALKYARALELGYRRRVKGKGKSKAKSKKMGPWPYLRPSLDRNRKELLKLMARPVL